LTYEQTEASADGKTKTCERMIPFVSAFIDHVDLPAKRIRADWQLDY
jgi:16S rRNA processing protein RimM